MNVTEVVNILKVACKAEKFESRTDLLIKCLPEIVATFGYTPNQYTFSNVVGIALATLLMTALPTNEDNENYHHNFDLIIACVHSS